MSYLIYLEDQGFSYKPKKGRIVRESYGINNILTMGWFLTPWGPLKDKLDHKLVFTVRTLDEKDIPEYQFEENFYHVVSGKFKGLGEENNITGVEFLPVEIKMTNCEPVRMVPDYWLMNVYETLDIIDMKKSDLKLQYHREIHPVTREYCETDQLDYIMGWNKLVLTVDHINHDLFRLPGMGRKLFISERFLNILEANGIRNLRAMNIVLDTGQAYYSRVSSGENTTSRMGLKYFGEDKMS